MRIAKKRKDLDKNKPNKDITYKIQNNLEIYYNMETGRREEEINPQVCEGEKTICNNKNGRLRGEGIRINNN